MVCMTSLTKENQSSISPKTSQMEKHSTTSLLITTVELCFKKTQKSKKCSLVITSALLSARNVNIVFIILTLFWIFLRSFLTSKKSWMFTTALMLYLTIKLILKTTIVLGARAEPHAFRLCAHFSYLRFWSLLSKDMVPLILSETLEECSAEIEGLRKMMRRSGFHKHSTCAHLFIQRPKMWL